MELRSTAVSRCLEKKLLLFGFELPDVLVVFMLLAILDLTFGRSAHKLWFVWCPVAAVALFLRIAKRGKPDNFLVHWARFHFRPPVLSAFAEPSVRIKPPHLS